MPSFLFSYENKLKLPKRTNHAHGIANGFLIDKISDTHAQFCTQLKMYSAVLDDDCKNADMLATKYQLHAVFVDTILHKSIVSFIPSIFCFQKAFIYSFVLITAREKLKQ